VLFRAGDSERAIANFEDALPFYSNYAQPDNGWKKAIDADMGNEQSSLNYARYKATAFTSPVKTSS